MASPQPPEFQPGLSNLERKFDPIAKRRQSEFALELEGARRDFMSSPNRANFDPKSAEVVIENLARARMRQNFEQSLVQTKKVNPDVDLSSVEQPKSVLDSLGLGPLREAETVGAAAKIAGPIIGGAVARRFVPPPATSFMNRALDTARATLGAAGRAEFTGAMLGAAAGSVIDQQLVEASQSIRNGVDPVLLKDFPTVGFFISGPVDSEGRFSPFRDRFTSLASTASKEMLLEAAGFGVGEVLNRGAFAAFSTLVGDEKLARRALEEAERVGVPVGLVDVVDPKRAPLAGSIRKIFATLGPTGSGFRSNLQNVQTAIRGAALGQIRGLSHPIGVIADMASRGEDVNRITRVLSERGIGKFRRVWDRFVRHRDESFNRFFAQAGGVQVSPATFFAELAQTRARYNVTTGRSIRRVREDVAGELEGFTPADLEMMSQDIFENVDIDAEITGLGALVDDLARIEPFPNVQRMDDLAKKINAAIESSNSKFVQSQLMQLRAAVNQDIRIALRDRPDLLELLDSANSTFEQGIALLGGKAGNRVRQVAPDFGKQRVQTVTGAGGRVVKNAGPKTPDALLDVLSGADSAGEVRQLAGMLGEIGNDGTRLFRQAAAMRLNRAMSESLAANQFSVKKSFKALGLLDPSSARGRVTTEYLAQSGVSPEMLKTLARVADRALPEGISLDAVATAQRRVALAGVASGLAAASGLGGFFTGSAIGGISTGMATAAFAYALGRYSGFILSNPRMVRAMIDLGSPTASPLKRNKAFQTLLGAGFLAVDEAVTGGVNPTNAPPAQFGEVIPAPAPTGGVR